MIASLSICSAVFGMSPWGKRMEPYDVGAKSSGVQGPSFRSNVSIWLGAPERKMRMQFFAELRSVGLTDVASASRRALATSAKNDATTEVPASFMK
jgi:hypothetical protein